jgi:lipopolysaccharide/colanic/teichoic acid biosynthesis glycosyltransferase
MTDAQTDALKEKAFIVPLESSHSPDRAYIYADRAKRVFDIITASMIIVFCAPLMGIVALLIKLDGGPVFFGHSRVGYGHRSFACWKFRTMVVNADKALADLLQNDPVAREIWNRDFKLPNDPRVNWLGRLLRASSIDELPQLWNVIKGDMSLVGPRPITVSELERYGANAVEYLSCRPGITGLWQVSGRSNLSYAERVALDTRYVRTWTFMLDIKIILRTFTVVLNRKGAF